MVGASIYNSPFINIWLEQFYYSLPLKRRILAKLGKKIQKEEFEEWLFKRMKDK